MLPHFEYFLMQIMSLGLMKLTVFSVTGFFHFFIFSNFSTIYIFAKRFYPPWFCSFFRKTVFFTPPVIPREGSVIGGATAIDMNSPQTYCGPEGQWAGNIDHDARFHLANYAHFYGASLFCFFVFSEGTVSWDVASSQCFRFFFEL